MTALIVIVIAVTATALIGAAAFALIVINIQLVDHSGRLTTEPRSRLDAATRRLLGSRCCPDPRQTKAG
jgi:hypothetical protein